MIKLKNILCEETIQNDLLAFESLLATRYPEIEEVGIYYDATNGSLFISDMYIKPNARGQGIGSKVMTDIINYADRVRLPLVLIPDPSDDGMSRNKLIAFYKKFGFVVNKGRKMDYSLSVPFATTMVRYPKS